jgi:TRAP transporter TAXI family solute receptor
MLARTHLCAAVCLGALALASCGGSEQPGAGNASTAPRELTQLTIASNPAGTHVYAVAAGLAKVLQEKAGIRTTIRPFSGSSVYLPLLQRGEIALGLNISIDSYLSYEGLPPYDTPMRNLRLLGMMFPLPIMYMVRADSDIQTVEDLRNKRVVITFRANAALNQLHRAILATGGLDEDDVQPVTVAGLPEAMRMLTEGRADAVPTGLNTALALQVNSAISGGIRYITLGSDQAKLAEIMPGAKPETITPGPNTVGVPAPIQVAGIVDYLNTGVHLTDEQAYMVIKTIHGNWAELRRDYSQMSSTPSEAVAPMDNLHPYHPGAVRYYKEAGLWTDAHEANQARLLSE